MVVLFVVVVLCLAGLFFAGGFTKTPSLRIKGSTTIQPMMDVFSEEYEKTSGVIIDIMGGGSGVGINSVMNGLADIGMSSRELKPGEGDGLVRIPIAIDIIVIIVNSDVSGVENLTQTDIIGIFSGNITNWSELGGPNLKILPVIREAGSGTRDFFEGISGPMPDDARYPLVTSNGAMVITVNNTPGAIGYVSIGSVTHECTVLKYNGREASDAGYELSRELLLFTKGTPTGDAAVFIDWILNSPKAQEILISMGFLPITQP